MSTNTGGASPRVLSLQNSGNNPQSALPDSDLQLPAGALDCHVHVIDPLRYPCPLMPGYLPPPPARTDSTALDSVLQQHGVAGAAPAQLRRRHISKGGRRHVAWPLGYSGRDGPRGEVPDRGRLHHRRDDHRRRWPTLWPPQTRTWLRPDSPLAFTSFR